VLIDTHCHVDQYPNPQDIVGECEKRAVRVIAVTNLPSDFVIAADRLKGKRYVTAALGMHPLMAAKAIRELSAFRRIVPHVEYVGEVGLDYSPVGLATKAVQERVFDEVLGSLGDRRRFITIHSRRAERAVLERLQSNQIRGAVFHWFTGSASDLKRAVEAGHFVSVNAAMLQSEKGIALVRSIPRDAILVETDGPFCKFGDRPSNPTDVEDIYRRISAQIGCSQQELQNFVSANFAKACGSAAE
jgi:TatD DNase family protein